MTGEKRNRGASGFTLIEMLISIGITNVVLVLGALSFAEIMHMRAARDGYFEKLAAAEYVLRSVERDVRGAREIAGADGDDPAEADMLILRSKIGEVVYLVHEGRVRRIERTDVEARDEIIADVPGVRVSFDLEGHSPQDARSVATTVEWDGKPEIGISHPALSLRVALGERRQTP